MTPPRVERFNQGEIKVEEPTAPPRPSVRASLVFKVFFPLFRRIYNPTGVDIGICNPFERNLRFALQMLLLTAAGFQIHPNGWEEIGVSFTFVFILTFALSWRLILPHYGGETEGGTLFQLQREGLLEFGKSEIVLHHLGKLLRTAHVSLRIVAFGKFHDHQDAAEVEGFLDEFLDART